MPPFVPRKRHHSPASPPQTQPKRRPIASRAPGNRAARVVSLEPDPARGRTVEENQVFLDSLDQGSEPSLSEISSDNFEDALPVPDAKRRKISEDGGADTADEMDWEDAIGNHHVSTHKTPGAQPTEDLELTLDRGTRGGLLAFATDGKKGPSKIERQIRVDTHRMHVQFMLFHNLVRNGWACDKEVQSVLVSQLPEGVKKEVDRWRSATGVTGSHKPRTEQTNSAKGKRKGKGKSETRNQREWASDADPLEEGVPNLSRGDPLLRLLKVLATYWKKKFTVTAPGLRKRGYMPLDRLEAEMDSYHENPNNAQQHGERIKNLKELRKLARQGAGSRDVGALLFTALLRGLGLEARLVANLQPVGFGWSKVEDAAEGKLDQQAAQKQVLRGDADHPVNGDADMSSSEEEVQVSPTKEKSTKVNRKQKLAQLTPRIEKSSRTKGSRTAPINLSDSESNLSSAPEVLDDANDLDESLIDVTPSTPKKGSSKRYDRDLPYPIYWTEVLSPITNKYIPVDSIVLSTIANTPDLLTSFEPRGARANKGKQVLAYVVAYSADGTAKDVTVRYLKRHVWPGKTKGFRIPTEKVPIYNRRGKVKKYEIYDWFKRVISPYTRDAKARTLADEIEEQDDLQPVKIQREQKAGEETLQGYKNSTDFVLERHLRREEALLPTATPVKTFMTGKGEKAQEEPVFRRSDIVACKTVESWHKEGREIRPGEQPLKYVPMRAVTLIRKREIEEAQRETGEKLKQGLYSLAQTDWIIPPPIRDGKIPKNAFGNMDVYVPSMVPEGAVHVKLKGMAKICRRLEIDYAEACTGFEFGKQRAVPVLTGVVVAKENRDVLVAAWKVEEGERRRKEDEKRERVALETWKKFLRGMRVLERLREEHGDGHGEDMADEINPFVNKSKKRTDKAPQTERVEPKSVHLADMAGAFLHADDDGASDVGGGGFLLDDNHEHDGEGDDALDEHHDDLRAGSGSFLVDDHDNPRRHSNNGAQDDQGQQHHSTPCPGRRSDFERTADSDKGESIEETMNSGIPNTQIKAPRGRKGILDSDRPTRKPTASAPSPSVSMTHFSELPSANPGISNGAKTIASASKAQRGKTAKDEERPEDFEHATEAALDENTGARAQPKRRAARKSAEAVRSRYFEDEGEETIAFENGTSTGDAVARGGRRAGRPEGSVRRTM